ncbi:NlpC/P60 family protein [Vibrio astriarenae]|uniref:NlpC/P60 family protein n=1 Tax=Vibrio astriarenae TaxID=1481923 RepID=UPI003736E67C
MNYKTPFLALALLITGCATAPSNDYSQHTLDHQYNALYQSWQGVPYVLGGNTKQGIDCSAFVQVAYSTVHGKHLPRTTSEQSQVGKKVTYSKAREGDLVFFKTGYKTRHVGIYLGGNQFLHASTSRGVIISRLDNPYWADKFWHFRSVI